jgi:hypothetical protein
VPKPVDRHRFPHDYIGPSIRGLKNGAPCVVIATQRDGYRIRTADGRVWSVDAGEVERVA